ncbi:uncharacterized protein LAJ45_09283 [Morchella importuna]|uniref:uncharacterized protein n=1 Tax=Morchella importuna TaxID=1174673 RepID=UPI001E8ECA4E|nr:uncharacterized protein LAJ45_09283 [Morchella importuna]KAH8146600.1 hypothetical protein LAJ45_09283 [Morchella importuna]
MSNTTTAAKQAELALPGTNNFAKLPTEITLNIFSYLSHSELFNSALVCREWYFISTAPTLHYALDLTTLRQSSLNNYVPPATLSRHLCTARHLTFNSPPHISTNSILYLLTHVSASTNLRTLTLSSMSNARSASPALAHFFAAAQSTQLTHVDLSNTSVTTPVISALLQSHRGTLRSLILDFTEIGDGALKAIATGTALERVSIAGCFGLSKGALKRFLVRRIPGRVKAVGLRWLLDVRVAWVWEMLARAGVQEGSGGVLAEVDVGGCERLTLADIERVEEKWPGVKVRHTAVNAKDAVWGYRKYVAFLASLQAEGMPLVHKGERAEAEAMAKARVYPGRNVGETYRY